MCSEWLNEIVSGKHKQCLYHPILFWVSEQTLSELNQLGVSEQIFSKAKPILGIPNQFCVTRADFSTPLNILGESHDLHMNVGIRCFILLCGAETGAVCENSPIFI